MAKWSRATYTMVARILKRNQAPASLIRDFSVVFAEDNERFDEHRFYEACGEELEE